MFNVQPTTVDLRDLALRDQFAMAALMGELACQQLGGEAVWWPLTKAPDLARRCYAIADAMMEARK